MHPQKVNIYLTRLNKFRQRIEKYIFPDSQAVQLQYVLVNNELPESLESIKNLELLPIKVGQKWGEAWQRAYFQVQGEIPQKWQDKEVALKLNLGGEGLVYSASGEPLQSITNRSVLFDESVRDVIYLDPQKSLQVEFWVEVSAAGMFGINRSLDPYENKEAVHGSYQASVQYAYLSTFDRNLWALALDLDILSDLLKNLPQHSVRFVRILKTVNQAIKIFADDVSRAGLARNILQEALTSPSYATELTVYAVGHGHIDTAWLWPISETIRKCARTFANQILLLQKYPTYVFGASQAQHYWFVKKYYPSLFGKMRAFIEQGRWEVQGAMWVEADCNLPSGESLTRQILYGKNFFKDEFGIEVDNLWLPDAFGFPPTLPQILKRSGINHFLTQKLSWNQINVFPYSLFIWRGIDGSQVLAHFPPENRYDSSLRPDSLIKGRDNFNEKEIADEFMSLFGMGDGGGGPKEEHIEYGLRLQNLEGAPKVKFSDARSFFEQAEKYSDELPVWSGDLYLEMHRGTFTSQAQIKKANRKMEFKIRVAEMLCSCLPPEQYPRQKLEQAWKLLLINQFHDIIPGSSINEVYRKALDDYRQVDSILQEIITQASEQLFQKANDHLVLFNSLPFDVEELIPLPEHWIGALNSENRLVPVQHVDNQYLAKVNIPALGLVNLFKADQSEDQTVASQKGNELILQNSRIRYIFDASGQLIEAFDKEAQQSVITPDLTGNVLRLFEDRPNNWDAWDIDPFYEEQLLKTAAAFSAEKIYSGPLMEGLQFKYQIGNSFIEQKVILRSHSKRLDFDTFVQWNESHRLLRVFFKVNIHAHQAAFDVQYGYYFRPTHRNSSFERARFEVVGHKYADLSRPDYGVALLSDSKYGYKVHENELSLSLLRSPTYPDPECDRGEQHFIYSLLPHTGDLIHSDVMREAWMLNQPPVRFEGLKMKDSQILPFALSGQLVHLEAVKKAEKEDCLIIRLVEARGMKSHTYLNFFQKPLRIVQTNLIEWDDEQEIKPDQLIRLDFEPFEIKTLKLFF